MGSSQFHSVAHNTTQLTGALFFSAISTYIGVSKEIMAHSILSESSRHKNQSSKEGSNTRSHFIDAEMKISNRNIGPYLKLVANTGP